MKMQQLVYLSTAAPRLPALEPLAILKVSRRNNSRDSITGLLYSDGRRFLQALEGPEDAVRATLERIKADPRHHDVTVLARRGIAAREFGSWAMAHHMPGMDGEVFIARVAELVAPTSPYIRSTFEAFAAALQAR